MACQFDPLTFEGVQNYADDNMHIETTVPREAFRPFMDINAAWVESLKQK